MQNLVVIKTAEDLETLNQYLVDKDLISVDTETTGLSKDAQVIGYSVCAEDNVGFYVVTTTWNAATDQLERLPTHDLSTNFFQKLVGKSLIMHNAVFDCEKIRINYGVELMPSLHTDTMALADRKSVV